MRMCASNEKFWQEESAQILENPANDKPVLGEAHARKSCPKSPVFCKRALQKRLHSAKETYNFKEPTSRSQPILRT